MEKEVTEVWAGFSWLTTETKGGLCWKQWRVSQSSTKQCNPQTNPAAFNFTILILYQGDSHGFETFCGANSIPATTTKWLYLKLSLSPRKSKTIWPSTWKIVAMQCLTYRARVHCSMRTAVVQANWMCRLCHHV